MGALLARNQSNAEEVIRELVQECWDGESDREVECVKLAELWRLDVEVVRKRFAKVRELKEGEDFADKLDAKIAENAKPLNGEIRDGTVSGAEVAERAQAC